MSLDPDLAALARHHGIAATYQDVDGRRQEADTGVVVALLHALGVPLSSPAGAGEVLREQQEAAMAALRTKCDILWSQLDALYFAYVEPGFIPPGAFVPEGSDMKRKAPA